VSLYGTGRAEGIATCALLVVVALLAHLACGDWSVLLAAWKGDVAALADPVITTALAGAFGSVFAYRFLRAQGRSRFTGGVFGAAYGLSPWLTNLADAPREQLAVALAPLALEAVCRIDRSPTRRTWLPFAGFLLAAPWLAGVTTTAVLVTLLTLAGLVRTLACGDHDDRQPGWRGFAIAFCIAVLTAANVIGLDPFGGVLRATAAAPSTPTTIAAATLASVRAAGPLVLWFAVLGWLRRQRHVDGPSWWALFALGFVPGLLDTLPAVASAVPWHDLLPELPRYAAWTTLLAGIVLGACGLDDFLDLPMRRRTMAWWLLAASAVGVPLLAPFLAPPLDGAAAIGVPATLLALAALTPTVRRLGILRWKRLFAVITLAALCLPLHAHRTANLRASTPRHAAPMAAPAGETAARPRTPQPTNDTADAPASWQRHLGFGSAAVFALFLWFNVRRPRAQRPKTVG
jgi:hypothetical protein